MRPSEKATSEGVPGADIAWRSNWPAQQVTDLNIFQNLLPAMPGRSESSIHQGRTVSVFPCGHSKSLCVIFFTHYLAWGILRISFSWPSYNFHFPHKGKATYQEHYTFHKASNDSGNWCSPSPVPILVLLLHEPKNKEQWRWGLWWQGWLLLLRKS